MKPSRIPHYSVLFTENLHSMKNKPLSCSDIFNITVDCTNIHTRSIPALTSNYFPVKTSINIACIMLALYYRKWMLHLSQCAAADKVKDALKFRPSSTVQTFIQRLQKRVERFPVKITRVITKKHLVNNISSMLFSQPQGYYTRNKDDHTHV